MTCGVNVSRIETTSSERRGLLTQGLADRLQGSASHVAGGFWGAWWIRPNCPSASPFSPFSAPEEERETWTGEGQ